MTLSNSTFDYNAADVPGAGLTISSVGTPPQGAFWAPAGATLSPTSMTFSAGNSGGGLRISLLVAVVNPASGPLTGTVTAPSGATLSVQVHGNPVSVPNGPFSLPLS
jgi:hypothetical protein